MILVIKLLQKKIVSFNLLSNGKKITGNPHRFRKNPHILFTTKKDESLTSMLGFGNIKKPFLGSTRKRFLSNHRSYRPFLIVFNFFN